MWPSPVKVLTTFIRSQPKLSNCYHNIVSKQIQSIIVQNNIKQRFVVKQLPFLVQSHLLFPLLECCYQVRNMADEINKNETKVEIISSVKTSAEESPISESSNGLLPEAREANWTASEDGAGLDTVAELKEHSEIDMKNDSAIIKTSDVTKEIPEIDQFGGECSTNLDILSGSVISEEKEDKVLDDKLQSCTLDGEKVKEELEEVRPDRKSKNMQKKEKRRELARLRKQHAREVCGCFTLAEPGAGAKPPCPCDPDFSLGFKREKRKADDDISDNQDIKKAKLETKALKAKRPGFSEERYNETSYYIENGLRKVYPYYFTFTTFTKGRWVGEKILDVFAKEFRAHPAEEYERCIKSGTLTVNYERVDTDCRLKHNDLLANIVHRHEVPVTAARIPLIYTDEETVVVDKPASIPVHPCGRYRHNTVVFILAKEYNLKNLRTIHRLDRLTSGLLLFGRTPKKAREMEQQIRTRQVTKQYLCRVEGHFPTGSIECNEPIEVVSYKIGVCKVSPTGKDCKTEFQLLSYNGNSSVVLCKPRTGRMHQIRVHLQYLGYPIVNDPLYNHIVFGANKGKGGITDKTDEQLIQDLIKIHNAENWLGMDGDVEYSMFKAKDVGEEEGSSLRNTPSPKDKGANPATPSSGASVPTPSPPTIADVANAGDCPSSTRSPSSPADGCPLDSTRTDHAFKSHMKTVDKNCYECKVRYRDPKPKDLVMFLHALNYSGPGWSYETKMPHWAAAEYEEATGE